MIVLVFGSSRTPKSSTLEVSRLGGAGIPKPMSLSTVSKPAILKKALAPRMQHSHGLSHHSGQKRWSRTGVHPPESDRVLRRTPWRSRQAREGPSNPKVLMNSGVPTAVSEDWQRDMIDGGPRSRMRVYEHPSGFFGILGHAGPRKSTLSR